MRALVIDDAKVMRMILRKILTSMGFDVSEASDGREGLAKLRQSPEIDLVLIDFYMPDMDGIEFVGTVRSDRTYDAVRLLMVTSEDAPARIEMALQAGADDYLRKPFGRQETIAKIQGMGISLSTP
jgi:two-component system chemotaxis response regulator CheY